MGKQLELDDLLADLEQGTKERALKFVGTKPKEKQSTGIVSPMYYDPYAYYAQYAQYASPYDVYRRRGR